ncbi:AP endonuclease, minor transcript isoform Apn1 [Schizosaccharomyces pombe]|uniref:Apurinic-apyrimidinic endonuclease 1 n=1 Tax=Schizosaccharomyces pombe (strain 972 / ATCC 24843) TaxID=284812 RepID=APN1_SCHPO|nr:DNA (apurinic or apyrimidinic site) lyase, endon uclease - fission yeast (Schizosaccharomyces pombe) [Schizosaccharomyces pombe]
MIGAHISAAGGVFNALINMKNINANSCAFFVKSQRKWTSPDLSEDVAQKFLETASEMKFDASKQVLVHGSYLINMANADEQKREQAFNCFVDDLKRCERLGVGLYNFHPGSTASCTKEEGINNLAECINRAHEETKSVIIVTENMAGQGNCLGGTFDDFAALKSKIKNLDRWRVCLDTCHTFAAGYDIRTEESYKKVIDEFDEKVGAKYVSGWHLNDSKAPLGSNRDLHENIGLGFLGLEPFRLIMNDSRWDGIPLVLETPAKSPEQWKKEVELLRFMVGKSSDDVELMKESARLSNLGAASRKEHLNKFEKKEAKKDRKKKSKDGDQTTLLLRKKQKLGNAEVKSLDE